MFFSTFFFWPIFCGIFQRPIFFWDFSAMFDDTEMPSFFSSWAGHEVLQPCPPSPVYSLRIDIRWNTHRLWGLYTQSLEIYTCDHVCICIHMYTISIYYIYTCILLYDIHAWYTTFYIQSDNDNDTTLRTLLVFDSEPAVIAALQGKDVHCRRCQTCVPRCAFPSFSHCSRHSGSFQHIFDRDQCSMTVQWNTREPFDVKFHLYRISSIAPSSCNQSHKYLHSESFRCTFLPACQSLTKCRLVTIGNPYSGHC